MKDGRPVSSEDVVSYRVRCSDEFPPDTGWKPCLSVWVYAIRKTSKNALACSGYNLFPFHDNIERSFTHFDRSAIALLLRLYQLLLEEEGQRSDNSNNSNVLVGGNDTSAVTATTSSTNRRTTTTDR